MIVEDDDLMHRLMVGIFTDLGADCSAFFSADDALMHLIKVKSPCALLVTDFTLPGQLDGRELALLMLQANVAVEKYVSLQLQTAANRILTIASVHERVYQNTDPRGISARLSTWTTH